MPSVPPVAVSVVLCPLQIVVVPEIPATLVETVFTLTVKVTAAEVALQGAGSIKRTQYVVVTDGLMYIVLTVLA